MSRFVASVQRLPGWTHLSLAILPAFILLVLGVPMLKTGLWLFQIATLAGCVWGLVFSILWWRALDEIRREAHKVAWIWGGSSGLVLAVAVIVSIEYFRPLGDLIQHAALAIPGWRPGPAGFFYGVVFTAFVQFAGYGLVWAGWWAATRRPR